MLLQQPDTAWYMDGVFACDELLQFNLIPRLIIANTDHSGLPGSHWVLFFRTDSGIMEYFDPLCKDMDYYNSYFSYFTFTHSWAYEKAKRPVQAINSKICGHFCLLYAYLRCKGLSMDYIIDNIPTEPNIVCTFVNGIFNNIN